MASKAGKSQIEKPAAARLGPVRAILQKQENVVLIITILLGLFFTFTLDGFAKPGNLLAIARSVSVLAILGLGMAVVVIARGLDLSQIASMALGTIIAIHSMKKGTAVPLAILAGVPMVLVLGLFNGFLVAFVQIPAVFVTIASALAAYGFGAVYIRAEIIEQPPPEATSFLFLGGGKVFGIPMPVLIVAVLAVVVHLFLSRTKVGLLIYAHGENPETARLSGVPVKLYTLGEFMACSLFGYLGGLIMAATSVVNLAMINSTMIFDVFLVVVLGGISLVGGRGGVWSVIVGVALIGTLLNGMIIANIDPNFQNIIKGAMLLIAVIIDNRLHPLDEETMRHGETI